MDRKGYLDEDILVIPHFFSTNVGTHPFQEFGCKTSTLKTTKKLKQPFCNKLSQRTRQR